jgi:cell division protein FtsL
VSPSAAATTAAPRHGRAVRRSPAPRIPRRVSGHAPRRAPAPARTRALRVVHGLARGRLDGLLRGRAVIALVTLLLTGIVFTQVSLLKLNASIGRAVETEATLQRENAALEESVSRLSSGERIQAMAERLGMVMPSASEVRFRVAHPGQDARRALRVMRAPDPQAALAATSAPSAATSTPAQAIGTATTPTTTPTSQGTAPSAAAGAPSSGATAPSSGAAAPSSDAAAPPSSGATAPSSGAAAPSTGTAPSQTTSPGAGGTAAPAQP